MRRLATIGLLVCVVMFAFQIQSINAKPDIHVPYDYLKIQWAIDNATSGEVIRVHAGTYYEHIIVDKKLSLIGDGETTIIDGSGTGTVVNVTSSNVLINGFRIQNSGPDWGTRDSGIFMDNRQYCITENNYVENCRLGIYVEDSSHITITDNTMANNDEAIRLERSSDNNVAGNNLANNDNIGIMVSHSSYNAIKTNSISNSSASGIHIQTWSTDNVIYGNTLKICTYGVLLSQSDNNTIFHNNFIDNTNQAWLGTSYNNEWDIGWPNGGNYWSDHTNTDVKSGQYQSGPGSDGISDTAYTVYSGNVDKYPCAGPISYFDVYFIMPGEMPIISNSTVSDFRMNTTERVIMFKVTGDTGVGFCRVDIPNTIVSGMWQDNYTVLINGVPVEFGNWTEGFLTYIYFRYPHSTKEILIIPEFPSSIILPLFMMATLLALVIYKRKHTK